MANEGVEAGIKRYTDAASLFGLESPGVAAWLWDR
jgi:hypothetical protein